MNPFNSKIAVISRFNLLATLCTHGLLTACNHGGAYHAGQDQAPTQEASSTPIEHRLRVAQESKDDMLFNKAYMEIAKTSDPLVAHDRLLALYKLVIEKKLSFEKVLRRCRDNTGRILNIHHLSHSMYRKHYYLVLAVISAGVVDQEATIYCDPSVCVSGNQENLGACAERFRRDNSNDLGAKIYLTEIIKKLDNDMPFNKAYMEIAKTSDPLVAHDRLLALYELAIEKKLSFEKVLRRCRDNTGRILNVHHLSHSIYKKHYHLVSAAISAGVVNQEATIYCASSVCVSGEQENLGACAERFRRDNSNDPVAEI